MAVDNYRNWWSLMLTKYGHGVRKKMFFAVHPRPIPDDAKAHNVKHAFSAGLNRETRHYAFETEDDQKRFLYANPGASACANPLETDHG